MFSNPDEGGGERAEGPEPFISPPESEPASEPAQISASISRGAVVLNYKGAYRRRSALRHLLGLAGHFQFTPLGSACSRKRSACTPAEHNLLTHANQVPRARYQARSASPPPFEANLT